MLALDDAMLDVDEKNDTRMNFRTSKRIKRAIQQAAALSGVDDTSFVISAAYECAMKTLAAHERTMLQSVDHEAFFAALDNPPAPTKKLEEAFARHRETVVSK